jgi:hypothetical protein
MSANALVRRNGIKSRLGLSATKQTKYVQRNINLLKPSGNFTYDQV